MTIAIALTIAGSDSSGGAGIQADLKSFSALGVYGASVITALTAQNTQGVDALYPVPPTFVRSQIDAVRGDLMVDAIKIGMLGNADIVAVVAEGLQAWPQLPTVLDPVMVAQSGAALIDDRAVSSLVDLLFPLVSLVTPNLPEAARLLEGEIARNENEMAEQGQALLQRGAGAVLIKGGHGEGLEAVDVLVTKTSVERFATTRLATKNTHGTGCSLSSAIAAGLAQGLTLVPAIAQAKEWLTGAIASADELNVGKGPGPVHHFYRLWR